MTRFWNNKNVDIKFSGTTCFFPETGRATKFDIYVFIISETGHVH
jgi:hypothetical protein